MDLNSLLKNEENEVKIHKKMVASLALFQIFRCDFLRDFLDIKLKFSEINVTTNRNEKG